WNSFMVKEDMSSVLPLQQDFYNKYIHYNKDKVVVIISDAMRYEVGHSLFLKLQSDEKCTTKLEAMLSVLPSNTRLGMAALLPHKTLEMTDEYKVLVDEMSCDDLKQREAILNKYSPNSRCVQFDDVKVMKKDGLRETFTGMDVVYIYHNQIDARGDKLNTENEVFTACKEAIDEIHALIKRLSASANTYHFIVTADHGFIYKRDKLQESDKIINGACKDAFVNRRFIISEQPLQDDGIVSLSMGKVLDNSDKKVISFPLSSNVFKVSGGGQNYVHGGSSPQEMIIPVIDVKTEKGHIETYTAQITLVSMVQKITNLISSLDFIQSEPLSDVVKVASYIVFFISEDNEKISNECIYVADKIDNDPQKRIFRLRFNFKNKKYDKSKRYYLVAYDEKNGLEVLRHDVVMDIAFSNNFDFGF
ncbi:MAG: BREX-1 system phosphatase PglZ type A, partial [Sedimentibacter sp.]